MITKFSKIIICVIATMCLFCSSLTVFAENGDVDFDFNIQPIEPTTQEEIVETEKETQKETEKTTVKATEKETEKPTKPQTTKKQEKPENNNSGNNVNVQATAGTTKKETTEVVTEETTDEPLPDGAFYVYLERNNGQRRLKTVMKKPGLVPEPAEPEREGYIFDGWYSDAKFKNPWNFFTSKANKEMTIYAKWAADPSTIDYDIIIEDTVGGSLEVNPAKASLGEPVVITVIPDEGKRLVQGSVRINGEPSDFLSFVMPKGKVTISAAFEDIPEKDETEDEKSKLPLFVGVGVVVVVLLIAIIIVAKRRNDFNADLDPDEELYTEDDHYDDWIDETIVVEDGFKEGKKVVESVEPDYGTPDLDSDDE